MLEILQSIYHEGALVQANFPIQFKYSRLGTTVVYISGRGSNEQSILVSFILSVIISLQEYMITMPRPENSTRSLAILTLILVPY